jgi:ubiquinone/menaquinone biosynthesis C-methylase UbiE
LTNDENLTKETYTHGYNRAQQTHLRRNVDTHGGFFTPHLKKGMKVLDCGCGPGSITLGFAEIVDQGETVGIDIGTPVIETANKLAADQENASFQEASICFLTRISTLYSFTKSLNT